MKRFLLFGLISLLIFGLLTFAIHQIFGNNIPGLDYIVYWHAGRALFLDGQSPYSQQVTEQNQYSVYGRLAQANEHAYPFSYPMFILFGVAPLSLLNIAWSQAAWMALNLVALFMIPLLGFSRAPRWITLSLLLFYPVYFTLIIGNFALVFSLILMIITDRIVFRDAAPPTLDMLYGFLLAWMTGKPQLVWLFVILLIAAALHKRRIAFIYGFFFGLLGLNTVALLLVPDWPIQWLNVLAQYPGAKAGHQSPLAEVVGWFFVGPTASLLVTVIGLALTAICGWLLIRWWRGQFDPLRLIAFFALVTNLLDPSSMTPDRLILLVPFFIWAVSRIPSGRMLALWLSAALFTNLMFVFSNPRYLPGLIELGLIGLYLVWLVTFWFFSQRSAARSKLAAP